MSHAKVWFTLGLMVVVVYDLALVAFMAWLAWRFKPTEGRKRDAAWLKAAVGARKLAFIKASMLVQPVLLAAYRFV